MCGNEAKPSVSRIFYVVVKFLCRHSVNKTLHLIPIERTCEEVEAFTFDFLSGFLVKIDEKLCRIFQTIFIIKLWFYLDFNCLTMALSVFTSFLIIWESQSF